jgi:hypothetical protein
MRIEVNDFLDRTLDTFARAGLPLSIVSGGSTPTAFEGGLFHGVNEGATRNVHLQRPQHRRDWRCFIG